MLHTLRQWINNDEKWRGILRGLQKEFYHQTVTTAQIENYIMQHAGLDLTAFFNQYLRDTRIPTLEYQLQGKKVSYRYTNIVPGFAMPIQVSIDKSEEKLIKPISAWQELKLEKSIESFTVDPDYYIFSKEVKK